MDNPAQERRVDSEGAVAAGAFTRRHVLASALTTGTALLAPSIAFAAERSVFVAPPGFNCRSDQIQSLFPKVSAALAGGEFARLLVSRMTAVNGSSLRYRTDALGKLGGDGAVVAALVFDDESVFVEQIRDVYKLTAIVSAQLLFFDFSKRLVVAAYPISETFIDAAKRPPDEAMVQGAVHKLVNDHVATQALALAATAAVNADGLKPEMGFGTIAIADAVRPVMPAAMAGAAPAWLAQQFAKALTQRHHLSIVPYVTGARIHDASQAISGSMALSVADGETLTLRLPKASYLFDVEFAEVRRLDGERLSGGARYIYGAAANLTLRDPLTDTRYFSGRVKNGESRLVPATQTTIEDWPAYSDAIVGLFRKFADALAEPTAKWAEIHAYDAAKLGELQAAGKVIAKCS